MPSPAVSDFAYAALLYPDDSDEKGEFAKGDVAGDKTLSFSFPRPESTEKLTIEIFAFKEGTTAFSEDDAILWGSDSGLGPVGADGILNVGTVKLEVKSGCEALGEVSLKVRVPAECSLEIDDTTNFDLTGESPDFIITQKNGDGIEARAYSLTLTVKKEDLILYVLSEYINVLPGMCTNKWSDTPSEDGARVIDETSFSTTVYVRGSGGWYEGSPYASSALADDENFGSFLAPLETIQRAVDKVLAMNDGASDDGTNNDDTRKYTIYVDGQLTNSSSADMVVISDLAGPLNLTIKALSGAATLDAGGLSRVIYVNPNSGTLNLTLENLLITGGNATSTGGGMYIENATVSMENCTLSKNKSTTSAGSVYAKNSKLNMKNCTITENTAVNNGGGFYIFTSTLEMNGGTISGNTAGNYCGGVFISDRSTFIMRDGIISGNGKGEYTAKKGGGVYVANTGTFTMEGGTISNNTATDEGGGVYVASATFNMSGSAEVTEENDVCLYKGITITVAGALSAEKVATITPASYTEGTQVLSADGVSAEQMEAACGKFAITPQSDGTEWKVELNGTQGVLAQMKSEFYVSEDGYDSNPGTQDAPFATIQKAVGKVIAENNGTREYTIYVSGTIAPGATRTTNGMADFSALDKNLTLTIKALSGTATLDANQTSRVIYANPSSSVSFNLTLENLKITGGIARNGGGLYVGGTIIMEGGAITGNNTSGSGVCDGGGVFLTTGTFTMNDNAAISNNVASGNGGGVFISGGTLILQNGTISDNKADSNAVTGGAGGGVYVDSNDDCAFILEGGTIIGNTSNRGGAGVYNKKNFTMTGGTISGNISEGSGGGVYTGGDGMFIMDDGEISGNKANYGGGVYLPGGCTFIMNNGTITGNTATSSKAGVFGTFTHNGGTVQSN